MTHANHEAQHTLTKEHGRQEEANGPKKAEEGGKGQRCTLGDPQLNDLQPKQESAGSPTGSAKSP